MTETVNAWRVLLLLAMMTTPTVERHDFLLIGSKPEAFRIDIIRQIIKIDVPPRDERR